MESTKLWVKTSKDASAFKARGKKAGREAKEAEQAAKDLGVWDEFYGSGTKGKRNGQDEDGSTTEAKGKGKGKKEGGGEGGEDGLAALILKRQRDREGGLNALAEKYKKIEDDAREKKKAKKGGKKVDEQENEEPPVSVLLRNAIQQYSG